MPLGGGGGGVPEMLSVSTSGCLHWFELYLNLHCWFGKHCRHLLTGAACAPVAFLQGCTFRLSQDREVWRVLTTASDVGIVTQGPGGSGSPASVTQRWCVLIVSHSQNSSKREQSLWLQNSPTPSFRQIQHNREHNTIGTHFIILEMARCGALCCIPPIGGCGVSWAIRPMRYRLTILQK